MLISKKRFAKIFFNYSLALYQECGRKLGANQQRILRNKIEQLYKNNTIKGIIKAKFKGIKKGIKNGKH